MGAFFQNPALALSNPVIVNDRLTEAYGYTAEMLEAPVPDDDYGIEWPRKPKQYIKELHAYKAGGMGLEWNKKEDKWIKRPAWRHMVNAIKLDLPNFKFVFDGYINTECLRVIKAFCENDDLGIAGAASSGKTFPIAACILQDWKAAPNMTLSFVCTTSMGASEDRIWGAIVKMFQSSRHKIGTYIPHKYVIVFGKFSEDAADRDMTAAIKALAIPRGREGQTAIDTMRGRKQDFVRVVFDELPEMDLYVTKGAVNLESTMNLKCVYIGNPMSHMDAHGQMLQPSHPLGFKSINKDTPEWETRTGRAIFLNGEWAFNFQAPKEEPIPFQKISNWKMLEKMLKRCHGNKESLEYYRNAIGFWPDSSISVTVLTTELITEKKCEEMKVNWRQLKRKRICGFDTSFTIGGDRCVAQFGEVGETIGGRKIVLWLKEVEYMVPSGGVFEDEIAKLIVDDCIKYGVKPDGFGMDISADGGKIMRAIIRYWLRFDTSAAEVVPISSMEKPSERIVSNVDPRKCCDAFDRKVTEYWMMVREAVLCEAIKGMKMINDAGELKTCIKHLCTRIYEIRGKKFCLETKPDMKERTLGESPDHGDAFCYMIEMARRHGLVLTTPDDEDREDEEAEEIRETRGKRGNYDTQYDDWGEREVA